MNENTEKDISKENVNKDLKPKSEIGPKVSINKSEVEEDIDLLLKFKTWNFLFFIPFIGIWFWAYKYYYLDTKLKSKFVIKEFYKINVKWHLIFILISFLAFFINLYPFLYRFIIRSKILFICFYVVNKS